MRHLFRDVRVVVRSLSKNWGFSLVAILTLGLGVGATTAIFSVVNGVLLRPLPFEAPDEIVTIWHRGLDGSSERSTTTPANFYAWKEQAHSTFESMAAYSGTTRTLTGQGDPERVVGVISAGSIFHVLGAAPAIGRTFSDAEDRPGAPPVVVLSHAMWERLFGREAAVRGQTLDLDGTPHTVIGVMPRGFRFPDERAEYWIPARLSEEYRTSRDQYFLTGLARLRDGAALEAARTELETVMARLRMEYPQGNANIGASVVPLHEVVVGAVRARLQILMGAVGFVLLIACANLASLLLARAEERRSEIALRSALGASHRRLIGLFLTESVALAVVGGLLGIAIAWGLLKALLVLLSDSVPRLSGVGLDPAVLAFAVGASLLSGAVVGLFPAFLASCDPSNELRTGTRTTAGKGRTRQALVVAEVALAVVLLCGAGLLMRSFVSLQHVDPGVTIERTLTFSTSLPSERYPVADRVGFFETARERLAAVPGVTHVDVINNLPVTGTGNSAWFNIVDRPFGSGETPPAVAYRVVTPGFPRTMGIGLIRGRHLTRDNRRESSPSLLINEELARQLFPEEDPIGRDVYLGAPDNRLFESATIVGIVRDVRVGGLDSDPLPVVYVPHAVMPYWSGFSFVVRTINEPETVASAVRTAFLEIDPELPLNEMRSMEDVVATTITPQRSSTILLSIFASIALAMAVLGVYGVLSYTVNRRRREMGIRIALGARSVAVQTLVIRTGLRQVGLGILIGLAGAAALTRVMNALLFETSATDPLTFAAVSLALVTSGALASYLPALRASRANPIDVLRTE